MTEKNFDTAQFGEWYVERSGQLVHLNRPCDLDIQARVHWREDGTHSVNPAYDLITHIRPPVVVPMPEPSDEWRDNPSALPKNPRCATT